MQKTKFRGKLFCLYINGDVTNIDGKYIGWVDELTTSQVIYGEYSGVALDYLIKDKIVFAACNKNMFKSFIDFLRKKIKPKSYIKHKKAKETIEKNDEILTTAEKVVYEMTAKGMTAKQISEHLGLKPKSIYVIRWKAKKKLNK